MVITKTYSEPPICKNEILRYAGCKGTTDELLQFLLEECLEEVLPKLSYKICYMEFPLKIIEDRCNFGYIQVISKDLAKNLQGCEKVLLFAATIGVEIDRLIRRYGAISPAKAVLFQAIGAERIESLCDAFCEEIEQGAYQLHPRFSPGYGDMPLETQKDIFRVLQCEKNIGVSLNDSLLMAPSKSVTALVGLDNNHAKCRSVNEVNAEKKHNCIACNKFDCLYRR